MKKIDIWKQRIEQFNQSGLSALQWCKKENLKLSTFQYWERKIKHEECVAEEVAVFAEVKSCHFAMVSPEKEGMSILWNQYCVTISSKEEAELAANFFMLLEKRC